MGRPKANVRRVGQAGQDGDGWQARQVPGSRRQLQGLGAVRQFLPAVRCQCCRRPICLRPFARRPGRCTQCRLRKQGPQPLLVAGLLASTLHRRESTTAFLRRVTGSRCTSQCAARSCSRFCLSMRKFCPRSCRRDGGTSGGRSDREFHVGSSEQRTRWRPLPPVLSGSAP